MNGFNEEVKEINKKPVVGKLDHTPIRKWFDSIADKAVRFDEDPFVTVFSFTEGIYSIYCQNMIDGMSDLGGAWAELIEGPEKAMLIDTGFGMGDIKAVIRYLIGDKELIVANTHYHSDHSGGNPLFDEVFCHEDEVEELKGQMTLEIWERERNRSMEFPGFDDKFVVPLKNYTITGCPDHTAFDLGGGHIVEMVFLPGHTPGGCGYLDHKNRILFSGDAIMSPRQNLGFRSIAHSENMTVECFRNSLAALAGRLGEFDRLFSGHRIFILDKKVVTDLLQACDDILEDPDCNEVYEMMRGNLVKIHTVGDISMTYGDQQIK